MNLKADLTEVADELYGLLPAEFTAARNSRAKQLRAEDRRVADQVARLPKPSVSAGHRPREGRPRRCGGGPPAGRLTAGRLTAGRLTGGRTRAV